MTWNAEAPRCTSSTVEMLRSIWQRVLQRQTIGVDDSFFKLGGNLDLADILFAEILRESGRDLPSATIFHAPTIARLASVVEQPTIPRFSPLIKLKAGSEWPPIFIVPGLDGRASFSSLVKEIQTDNPVYGILAKGLDGIEEPFDRVQNMAYYYLAAIGELQPEGPYILIGYSFGGLVALEMAHSLLYAGKQIALLVMIDAYPDVRYMPFAQGLQLRLRRMRRRFFVARQKTITGAASYFVDGLADRMRRTGVLDGAPTEGRNLSLSFTTARVKDESYQALANYRPSTYSGKIKFVKNESDPYFPGDPVAAWKKFATNMEVSTVSGDHLSLVTTHSGSIAGVIMRHLKEIAPAYKADPPFGRESYFEVATSAE